MKEKHLDYVLLKEEEYSRLLKEWGEHKVKKCIEKLDNFIPNSKASKHYTDHNRVLRGWVNDWYKKNYPNMKVQQNERREEIEVSDEAKKKTAALFRSLGKKQFGNNWQEIQKRKNIAEDKARNDRVAENYRESL